MVTSVLVVFGQVPVTVVIVGCGPAGTAAQVAPVAPAGPAGPVAPEAPANQDSCTSWSSIIEAEKMALINFDQPTENSQKHHHWMLPESHHLIVGPTNSGETNLLLNMVMRWLDSSELTVYTTSRAQGKYQVLADFYGRLGMKDVFAIREPDEVTQVSELDEAPK